MRLPSISRAVVAAAAAGLAVASAPAAARVPQGFVGMNIDQAAFDSHVDLGQQLDRMVSSGVETVRVAVDWSSAQPYRTAADVPPDQRAQFIDVGGVPTRFTSIDRIVGLTAARGLTLLPTVLYAPSWDAEHPGKLASPPKSPSPYAHFLTALIQRYGPQGTFWAQNPTIRRVAIRSWQVWNEPNLPDHWSDQPNIRSVASVPAYVRLLRAAHAAIKTTDPGATVVLAGLPDFAWEYLAAVYKVSGARGQFDAVAVHPYTAQATGVIAYLRKVRGVMDQAHDNRKPMLATEMGWPSSQGTHTTILGFETTASGQAKKLAALLPLLGHDRFTLGLAGFDYYTWIGPEPGPLPFNYAGLLRLTAGRIISKPALAAFTHGALALESCARKGTIATRCSQRTR